MLFCWKISASLARNVLLDSGDRKWGHESRILVDAVGSLLWWQVLKALPGYPHLHLVSFLSADACDLGASSVEVRGFADCAAPSVIVPGNSDREVAQRIPFSLSFFRLFFCAL